MAKAEIMNMHFDKWDDVRIDGLCVMCIGVHSCARNFEQHRTEKSDFYMENVFGYFPI